MTTPLEALAEALRDCRKFALGAEAPPEAILWCDPGTEFKSILPALRARLPDHHVGEGSKDVVRLVMGLIATMAALVLLIASAKGSYDTQSGELGREIQANGSGPATP